MLRIDIVASSLTKFTARVGAEIAKSRKVVQHAGIKMEWRSSRKRSEPDSPDPLECGSG